MLSFGQAHKFSLGLVSQALSCGTYIANLASIQESGAMTFR